MKKQELVRRITAWVTLGIFTVQPVLVFAEDIVADPSAPDAQRPVVTEAGSSGIPLVQITAPSGEVSLAPVMLVDGDKVTTSAADLAKSSVTAEIIGDEKGPKFNILKF
ncbi:MAG: hypothetical protein ACFNQB_04325 [Selenomonas noxia]